MSADVGIVAIGRNEGERLKACLRSLPAGCPAVYVDSGSTDDSVAFARSRGVTVVELPTDRPFTAARARNAGAAALPDTDFVQMLDGDCTLDPAWMETARHALATEPDLAVVFGRRRERHPERSIYNRLCDAEWDVPVGLVDACGGDALFRRTAFTQAGGYADDLIAGEEPDLCLRMGRQGWRVRRIDAEMTRHDAAMTRFGQWWRRTKRAGHAYAEHVARHGGGAFPDWRRQVRSIIAWGIALPLLILLAARETSWAWLVLLIYPVQVARIAWRKRRQGADTRFALASATFLVIGKFAEASGLLQFHLGRLTGRRSRLIEYKAEAMR